MEPAKWLVDGIAMTAGEVCEAAQEYGYAGDNPEEAAKVLEAWEHEVESPPKH